MHYLLVAGSASGNKGVFIMALTEQTTPELRTASTYKDRRSRVAMQRLRWGLFFLSPWFIGLFTFQLLPIVFTFFLSFTNYNATKEFAFGNFDFVGMDNYWRLYGDPDLISS